MCCATLGRPVANALAEAAPGRVWEDHACRRRPLRRQRAGAARTAPVRARLGGQRPGWPRPRTPAGCCRTCFAAGRRWAAGAGRRDRGAPGDRPGRAWTRWNRSVRTPVTGMLTVRAATAGWVSGSGGTRWGLRHLRCAGPATPCGYSVEELTELPAELPACRLIEPAACPPTAPWATAVIKPTAETRRPGGPGPPGMNQPCFSGIPAYRHPAVRTSAAAPLVHRRRRPPHPSPDRVSSASCIPSYAASAAPALSSTASRTGPLPPPAARAPRPRCTRRPAAQRAPVRRGQVERGRDRAHPPHLPYRTAQPASGRRGQLVQPVVAAEDQRGVAAGREHRRHHRRHPDIGAAHGGAGRRAGLVSGPRS